MLSVTGDDSNLFAVFTKGIELVLESSLELLAGNIRQLCLSNKGFGLGTDEFLLEDNDLW
jgi:hypothetical protein